MLLYVGIAEAAPSISGPTDDREKLPELEQGGLSVGVCVFTSSDGVCVGVYMSVCARVCVHVRARVRVYMSVCARMCVQPFM